MATNINMNHAQMRETLLSSFLIIKLIKPEIKDKGL